MFRVESKLSCDVEHDEWLAMRKSDYWLVLERVPVSGTVARLCATAKRLRYVSPAFIRWRDTCAPLSWEYYIASETPAALNIMSMRDDNVAYCN